MFEIGVIDEFEAAHALKGDFGAASRLHGHTYKVEVRLEAGEVDSTGTFYDIGRLKADLRAVLDEMHYHNLDEIEGLDTMNTTAEVVALYICKRMAASVRDQRVEALKVTVWESSSSFASYRETVRP
jgi:6-pyruvoyltetrahydropterin/6-carboxytetrahydropterin synthase